VSKTSLPLSRNLCRTTAIAAVLMLVLVDATAANDKYRFIYNSDGMNVFIDKEPPMVPEDTYSYVDEVAETQVTTFFICPNAGMRMLYPSETTGMLGGNIPEEKIEEIRKKATEKGGTTDRGIVNLQALVDAGHDPIEPIVDRANEKGLEIFLTFRLNEIHAVNEPESHILSDFWKDHPDWRVGKPGEKIGDLYQDIMGPRVNPIVGAWFWGALNFAIPEVRQRRLAEIRECCERYDVDGLDLDFQRFPVYFPIGEEAKFVETMTSWVREVRKLTNEIGEKRGRPFLLSVRTMAKPAQNLAIGLDPETWAKEGLVDFVVASHYLRNDYPIAIQEYRKLLPPDMGLYGSIEVEPERDTYRKIARQLWEDGVDGILLFNFFTRREGGKEPPFDLLNELGDAETIQAVKEQATTK
jgi:glycosyl hydrolase family 10